MITNIQLVNYCRQAVGHPYWYGCFGQYSTEALYIAKKNQYPKYYKWKLKHKELGTRVFDCVGLIKGCIWAKGIFANTPKYNSAQDVSANGMYSKCTKKGVINSLPEVPGVLVFKNGHVGVYVGNKKVIEAKGHEWGVIESKLSDSAWTHWGYCPWVSYVASTPVHVPAVQYFKKYTGKSLSIVDALKSIGAQSSYPYRKKIADKNGIKMYTGTPVQNIKMLNLLKRGKLIKP